ncbi:membrane protein, putative (macronuclear) [Tetrahymena thermophila SB210]|uniref:Membrane protein, putative n=1 Tax=Tetrahymena thermophila (strain SB210) TaxID=312017 RepID=Q24GG6_TETTS|nr:membrane protein, putative [Tetrahymena thermophila SB210]EAS06905.2 membrane protein, putative [Tetrahymena thermophila SB210]|eukprot:XP_001027147.2 membrane protein, putative [Tetrahymena thermophila SB210]
MIRKTFSLVIALAWVGFSVYLGSLMQQAFDESQDYGRYNLAFSHIAFDITVIVSICIFNFFWNNLQIFDAYYGLIPVARLAVLKMNSDKVFQEFNFKNFLITTLIGIWGVRLFAHIFQKWRGFPDQDRRITATEMRYRGVKRIFFWLWQQPFIAFMNALLISFLTLPVTAFYTRDAEAIQRGEKYNFSEILGYALAIYGLAVQSIADLESNLWRDSGASHKVCDTGLRRYLRYPQYYAEIVFWFGIWGACVSSFSTATVISSFVYWPIGFVIEALWLVVMTTIMDKRVLVRKEGWQEYKRKVRFGLIPFFRF